MYPLDLSVSFYLLEDGPLARPAKSIVLGK